MKRFLLRAAGGLAALGVILCAAGLLCGGRVGGLVPHWENGRLVLFVSAPQGTAEQEASPVIPVEKPEPEPGSDPAASVEGVIPTGELHSLELEADAAQVTVQPGDGWGLQVSGTTAYTAVQEDGVWMVTVKKRVADPSVTVTLTYPQGIELQHLERELGMGSLTVDGLSCRTADVEADAGEITLNDLTVTGDCSLEVGMGSIRLQGDLRGGAEIDCGLGEVQCTLMRPQSYGYTVRCDMGSVEMDGRQYDGFSNKASENPSAAVQYAVECDMGSVQLRFA